MVWLIFFRLVNIFLLYFLLIFVIIYLIWLLVFRYWLRILILCLVKILLILVNNLGWFLWIWINWWVFLSFGSCKCGKLRFCVEFFVLIYLMILFGMKVVVLVWVFKVCLLMYGVKIIFLKVFSLVLKFICLLNGCWGKMFIFVLSNLFVFRFFSRVFIFIVCLLYRLMRMLLFCIVLKVKWLKNFLFFGWLFILIEIMFDLWINFLRFWYFIVLLSVGFFIIL